MPYATSAVRLRAVVRSRETTLRTHLRADAAASTASPPAFVTIAIRPSCREGRGELVELICPTEKAEYFLKEGWTGQIALTVLSNFPPARNVVRGPRSEKTFRAARRVATPTDFTWPALRVLGQGAHSIDRTRLLRLGLCPPCSDNDQRTRSVGSFGRGVETPDRSECNAPPFRGSLASNEQQTNARSIPRHAPQLLSGSFGDCSSRLRNRAPRLRKRLVNGHGALDPRLAKANS